MIKDFKAKELSIETILNLFNGNFEENKETIKDITGFLMEKDDIQDTKLYALSIECCKAIQKQNKALWKEYINLTIKHNRNNGKESKDFISIYLKDFKKDFGETVSLISIKDFELKTFTENVIVKASKKNINLSELSLQFAS